MNIAYSLTRIANNFFTNKRHIIFKIYLALNLYFQPRNLRTTNTMRATLADKLRADELRNKFSTLIKLCIQI